MKKLVAATLAAVATAFAGCGGGASHPQQHHYSGPQKSIQRGTIPNQHRPCDPNNFYLQCAVRDQKAPKQSPLGAANSTLHGVDFAWGGPSCGTFQANGWKVAATYYDTHDMSKGWSRGLANYYSSCGVSHLAVWESTAGEATNGYWAGVQDAKDAAWVAGQVGEPSDRPIFFAVDCDCSGGSVASYFDGVRSVIGTNRTGAYAGYYPINYLFNTGRIKFGWQTYAWSGGNWDSRAKFRQYLNDNSVDYDLAIGDDYGQWPFKSAPTGPSHATIVGWVKGKNAAKAAWFAHNGGKNPLSDPNPHNRRLVTAYQSNLEAKAGYKHVFCWGPAVDRGQAVCQVIRPTYAAWLRAAESSRNQYWSRKCNKTPKKALCKTFAQRTQYFNGHAARAWRLNTAKSWATI